MRHVRRSSRYSLPRLPGAPRADTVRCAGQRGSLRFPVAVVTDSQVLCSPGRVSSGAVTTNFVSLLIRPCCAGRPDRFRDRLGRATRVAAGGPDLDRVRAVAVQQARAPGTVPGGPQPPGHELVRLQQGRVRRRARPLPPARLRPFGATRNESAACRPGDRCWRGQRRLHVPQLTALGLDEDQATGSAQAVLGIEWTPVAVASARRYMND